MIKYYNIIILMLALLIIMPSVTASLGIYKQNSCVEIKTILDASSVNISTISYPNSSVIISNVEMTKNGQSFNYTFCNTSVIGVYIYDYFDNSNNVYVNDFEITFTGDILSSSQGSLSIGIIISIIFLMFFFAFLGFKFMDYEKTFPIALFFIVLSIIIAVFGLYLGVIYSQDYLSASTSEPQSSLFTGVLYGLIGLTFIGLLWIIIAVFKEFKIRKGEKDHGENWDSTTKSYKY